MRFRSAAAPRQSAVSPLVLRISTASLRCVSPPPGVAYSTEVPTASLRLLYVFLPACHSVRRLWYQQTTGYCFHCTYTIIKAGLTPLLAVPLLWQACL